MPVAPAERSDENPPHKPSARAAEDDPRANLLGFYKERRPKWSFAIVYQAFRSLIGDWKLPGITLKTSPYEHDVLAEWQRDRSSPQAAMIDFLRPFYAWPDKLASLYSDRYRSAFIIGYLLAAFAVCMALLPVALGPAGPGPADGRIGQTLCGLAELAAIASILFLWWWARRRKWHNRWIDYRLAAELVRHLRLVAPLGGRRPFAQLLAHHANYGQPQATWMDWYVRAVARQIGLANGAVDAKYLADSLADMQSLIDGQAKYHAKAALRCHVIEHRLHMLGFGLLAISLIAGLLHLFHLLLPGDTATFICGFLPALGAALAGINNQGEFRRLAKRSHAMERNLAALLSRARKLRERITPSATASAAAATGSLAPGTPLHSSEVAALASDAAQSLLMEVLDWRVVFLDRPLEPPA